MTISRAAGAVICLALVVGSPVHEELFHVPEPPHVDVEIAQADTTPQQQVLRDDGTNENVTLAANPFTTLGFTVTFAA